jgi:Fe-S cluster assembly iron-binding protein IscA
MVNVTHVAIQPLKAKFKMSINEAKKPLIRFSMGIDCGGPQIRLTLKESVLENDEINDEIIEQDGIVFLINERDQVYFNDVNIDYVKT